MIVKYTEYIPVCIEGFGFVFYLTKQGLRV